MKVLRYIFLCLPLALFVLPFYVAGFLCRSAANAFTSGQNAVDPIVRK